MARQFAGGDLILAKLGRFPHWPAMIFDKEGSIFSGKLHNRLNVVFVDDIPDVATVSVRNVIKMNAVSEADFTKGGKFFVGAANFIRAIETWFMMARTMKDDYSRKMDLLNKTIEATGDKQRYCLCEVELLPADKTGGGKQMIQCMRCGRWFHLKCLKLKRMPIDKGSFACNECGQGSTSDSKVKKMQKSAKVGPSGSAKAKVSGEKSQPLKDKPSLKTKKKPVFRKITVGPKLSTLRKRALQRSKTVGNADSRKRTHELSNKSHIKSSSKSSQQIMPPVKQPRLDASPSSSAAAQDIKSSSKSSQQIVPLKKPRLDAPPGSSASQAQSSCHRHLASSAIIPASNNSATSAGPAANVGFATAYRRRADDDSDVPWKAPRKSFPRVETPEAIQQKQRVAARVEARRARQGRVASDSSSSDSSVTSIGNSTEESGEDALVTANAGEISGTGNDVAAQSSSSATRRYASPTSSAPSSDEGLSIGSLDPVSLAGSPGSSGIQTEDSSGVDSGNGEASQSCLRVIVVDHQVAPDNPAAPVPPGQEGHA